MVGEEEGRFGAVGDVIGVCGGCVQVELEPAVDALWVWSQRKGCVVIAVDSWSLKGCMWLEGKEFTWTGGIPLTFVNF